MFDHLHYVPILRWKRGERIALRELFESDRERMTPLIELVPSDFTSKKIAKSGSLADKLSLTTEQISQSWGNSIFFLDPCHIDHLGLNSPNRMHLINILADEAESRGMVMIPVIGLDRGEEYQNAVASIIAAYHRGVCVRVNLNQINNSLFNSNLEKLITALGAQPSDVDMLLDYQIIVAANPAISSIVNQLPHLSTWRTLIFSSGAFPINLTQFSVGQHMLQRYDWLAWNNNVISNNTIPRLPSFSDYTIQHPVFVEPPQRANVSASIRYTSHEYWVIMRGEGIFNPGGPGHRQYPAQAQLLSERSEFCGEDFSYGDEYIVNLSSRIGSTGTPETLIRAGINHHMTFVAREISNLSGS